MVIRHGGLSDVLNAVHHGLSLGINTGPLPSWVPSWSDASATDFLLDSTSLQLPQSPQSTPSVLHSSRKALSIQRVYCNLVEFTSRGALVHMDCLAEFWSEVIQPLSSQHHNLQFCEALMSDRIRIRTDAPNQEKSNEERRRCAAYLLAQYQHMHPDDEARRSSAEEEMLISISNSFASYSGRCWKEEVASSVPKAEVLPRCETIWRGRRLFLASGNYIGLGPEAMVEEDMIVIPIGSTTPCVLHPRENFYQFVGTANIPGILNGGVMQNIKEESIEYFDIG